MKKFSFWLPLAAGMLTLASCDEKLSEEIQIPDNQKEMISFSLSDGAASTKAGFGGSATFLAMRIQSNEKGGSGVKYTRTVATAAKDATSPTTATSYSVVTFSDANTRYWDDAHGRKSLLSVFAVAIPNNATDTKGLESKLAKGDESNTWGSNSTNTIAWSVTTTAQTKDATSENTAAVSTGTIDNEDLVYSNNIQAGGTDGVYRWNGTKYDPDETGATTHHNGQMLFFQNGMADNTVLTTAITDAPGHFDKGHMVFKHSLTRMTITLVEGDGYDKDASTDFQFTLAKGASAVSNITLKSMYTSGTLNLVAGTWSGQSTADIVKLAQTSTGNYASDHAKYPKAKYYTMTAQMLPDYVFNDANNTNVMEFTIDNNTYFITQNMLFDALAADNGNKIADYGYDTENNNKFTMQQGKNYNFVIKVDKTKIDQITATLAPWVDVTAQDFGLDNSHVQFTLRDNSTGDACTAGVNFYQKTEDLGAIYTDDSYLTNAPNKGLEFSGDYVTKGAATLTAMSAPNAGKYTTNWYFEDNKTAYHFRTISNNAKTTLTNGSGTKSYFVMTGGNGATLPDYHWGAPMKPSANLVYNTVTDKGYVDNVNPGITATESDIKITEMHMLSNIYITLETTTGTDAVVLSGATIKLTKLSNTGNVDMGTGYITPITPVTAEVTMQTPSDYWQTENVKTKAFQYAVIPQQLVRGSGDDDYIGITITTSDHNQYYVIRKLSEIYATNTKIGANDYDDPDQKTASDSDDDAKKTAARITRWYPNHNYHYNIIITKNKIDNITCTVAKWVDVTAADQKITLED